MWKHLDTTGRNVIVGGSIMGVAFALLVLGLMSGRLHVGPAPVVQHPAHCSSCQQDFDAAFLRVMEAVPATQRVEQRVLGSVTLLKVFLDAPYTEAVAVNPDLTCVVAFLRNKDLSIDPAVILRMIETLARVRAFLNCVPPQVSPVEEGA